MTSPPCSDPIADFLLDGAAADWPSLCYNFSPVPATLGLGIEEAYCGGGGDCVEMSSSSKRSREEPCAGPKSKACREKIRRDKLNDRFMELSSVLDPNRPPKVDKASILSDAARLLLQLRSEAQELKDSNDKLKETIKDLKEEKNELRDEKIKLKAEKERLEQQIKNMSSQTTGFMPPPIAFHPAAMPMAFAPFLQAPSNKDKNSSYPTFPSVAMWQWLPPAEMDTSKDAQLWPPNA